MDPSRHQSTNSEVEAYLSTFGPTQYSHMDLEKFTSNFSQSNFIGGGAYGKVYRGKISGGLEVAVKVLEKTDIAEETFLAEVKTMQASHRNLIKLYGYCFQPIGMKALVYEYMKNGSLDKFVYEGDNSIEWTKLYDIVIEVAKGLVYLHDGWHETIIHYDIKASNILLDINHSPKITDFGTAKLVKRDADRINLTRIRGTDGYNAPETWMPGSEVTNKCDVFSYGMMLFEVLGRRKNGNGENWFPGKVWKKFMSKQMVDILKECGIVSKQDREKAKLLSMVAFWCTQFGADERPSMAEVVLMLEKRLSVGNPPPPFPNWRRPSSSNITSELMVTPEIYSDDDERQQPQDSLQTGNSNSETGGNNTYDRVAGQTKIFTLAEVSKHNNSKDCWLVINKKVYDVTNFLGDHPGGSEVLLQATGKDATNDFEKIHHSSDAITMMDKFYVGMYDSITSLLSKLPSEKPQSYSRMQLEDFTNNFSQPLGSGRFGDVYKGQFPDGVLIAVKVLINIHAGKEKIMKEQFAAEVNTMGNTYHRNLIKLYGYCYEANTEYKALVYDYMENGSLDMILFEKKLDIPWAKLHNIAKEIAQGISYLHESCSPQIIHQDIKSANVLLDSNFSPKVKKFGLAKVNMPENQWEESNLKGARVYMAPEVNQLNQVMVSLKYDVYSFGMVVFDILGSKRNHVNKSWFPDQVWEKYKSGQLDEFILECGIKEEDKKNAKRLAIVALLCVEHNPQARPMLSNVVKMLDGTIKKLDTPVSPIYPNFYSTSESSSMVIPGTGRLSDHLLN